MVVVPRPDREGKRGGSRTSPVQSYDHRAWFPFAQGFAMGLAV